MNPMLPARDHPDAPYYHPWFDHALWAFDSRMYLAWNPRAVLTGWAGYNLDGSYRAPQFEGRFVVRCRDQYGEDYFVKSLEVDGEYAEPGDWTIRELWENHLEKWDANIFKYHQENVEDHNAEYDRRLWAESDEVFDDAARTLQRWMTPKQFMHSGDFIKSPHRRVNDWF